MGGSAASGNAVRRDGIPPRTIPILYFALAHAALLTALAVAVLRSGEASGFFYQPRMVALVHLVTLGWITASILGSLYVIGPMALRTPMPAGRADGMVWLLFAIGFSGVASHFWINAYGGAGWSALLALGAVLHVGTRALLGIRSAPVQSAVKLCLLLANLNILMAGGFGILLAFDKAHPFLPARELGNVFAHAHLSAIGWVGMMVMGTGLRMLPMILPSAMQKTQRTVAGALVMELGVVGLFVALQFGSPAAGIFALLIAAGFGIFLSQVGWMLRHRRPPPVGHPRPDLGVWHAVQALIYLVVSLGLGLFLAFSPESDLTYRLAPLYGVFGLLGFFGQLVVGVETRILPMFAAYYANRNACQVGPVIMPHQMTSRPLQWAVLLLWTTGIPLLAAGMSRSSVSLVRSGASLLLFAASAMTLNTILILRHAFLRPVPETKAPGHLPSTPAAR
jgi:hypothetical protein